ncbi:hypothetical protein GEMRC1_012443 [Eukaryota sp. GEM-RC1]
MSNPSSNRSVLNLRPNNRPQHNRNPPRNNQNRPRHQPDLLNDLIEERVHQALADVLTGKRRPRVGPGGPSARRPRLDDAPAPMSHPRRPNNVNTSVAVELHGSRHRGLPLSPISTVERPCFITHRNNPIVIPDKHQKPAAGDVESVLTVFNRSDPELQRQGKFLFDKEYGCYYGNFSLLAPRIKLRKWKKLEICGILPTKKSSNAFSSQNTGIPIMRWWRNLC